MLLLPRLVSFCLQPGSRHHSAELVAWSTLLILCSLQDEEAVKKLTVNPGTKSKLPKPVQDLIKMIFDVESMKKAMVEYEVTALFLFAMLCPLRWEPDPWPDARWELRD